MTATFGALAHVTGAIVISEVCFTAVAGDCHHVPRHRDRNRSDIYDLYEFLTETLVWIYL